MLSNEERELRDVFAAAAMANPAICTGVVKEYELRNWFGDRGGVLPWDIAAMQAYSYANAMLRVRKNA